MDKLALLCIVSLAYTEPVSNVEVTANSTDLVEFNSSVRLSCSSSGSSLSYLWMNSSSEVTVSDRVQLTDGNSNLTILSVTRYDQGPYECHVSNSVSNNISEPINLNISYGPENIILTLSPSQEYFGERSNINLSCSADSRPAAFFQWFLSGDLQSDTGPELRLMDIQMNQSGHYSCGAFNNKTLRNETSATSVVTVLFPVANVVATSNSTDLAEFSSVRLSCFSSGSYPSFLWMNSSSEVTASAKVQFTDGGSTLTILNVTRYDQGPFRCRVLNPVSNNISDLINLNISYGPENVQITGPSEIEETQILTLTCSADSTPSATYSWILNGTEIHNSAVFFKYITEPSDSGNYTCQARNNITERISSAVHKLSVKVKSPGGLSAGAIAGITIMICFIFAVVAAGGYFIYKRKVNNNPPPSNREEENVYENSFDMNKNKSAQRSFPLKMGRK